MEKIPEITEAIAACDRLSGIPVVFSPYFPAHLPPRVLQDVIYARDERHLWEWIDREWLEQMGIAP